MISKVQLPGWFWTLVLPHKFLDNRSRFAPREFRGDEGRNRFADSRRDVLDRDSREPQKWEHDLSMHRVWGSVFVLSYRFTAVRSQQVRVVSNADLNPRNQHKPPAAVDRKMKCPFLVRTFYSR